MKPAAAAAQPKYEYVKLKTSEEKTNPELLCDACCKKAGFKEYVSKPALQGTTWIAVPSYTAFRTSIRFG